MKVKLAKLTAILVLRLPAIIDATEVSTCVDSTRFVVDGLEKRTCDWVRADMNRLIEFCEVEEVRSKCPKTCGECCEDDTSFFMITSGGKRSGCDWIARQSKRRKTMFCDAVKN